MLYLHLMSTDQRIRAMSCGWEGNRRSGFALAMRHRYQWLIHVRAQGLSQGDERPPTLLMGYVTRYLLGFYLVQCEYRRPNLAFVFNCVL